MNTIRHDIVAILNEEPFNPDWIEDKDKGFVRVSVMANCWGNTKEYNLLLRKSDWETAKERGYFLG